jgi:uncharacterized protein (TIGR03089 family)
VRTVTGAILDSLLRENPAGPRITYYDDATGERVELSTATLANWAAKTSNLLRDELAAAAGSRAAVFLPAHWQTAAVLLGVWWVGAEVVLGGNGGNPPHADIALCTQDRLADAEHAVGIGEVAVLSLDAFGRGVAGLPVGITDFATSVRVHGDHAVVEPKPGPALAGYSVEEVLAMARQAALSQNLTRSDRVWSSADWASTRGLVDHFLAVLVAGASLVQVANPVADQERRRITEKVTRVLS